MVETVEVRKAYHPFILLKKDFVSNFADVQICLCLEIAIKCHLTIPCFPPRHLMLIPDCFVSLTVQTDEDL